MICSIAVVLFYRTQFQKQYDQTYAKASESAKDAVEEVKQVCHFVAEKKGGCGAVRQITEFILNARGDWDKIVNSYLQEGQGDAQ